VASLVRLRVWQPIPNQKHTENEYPIKNLLKMSMKRIETGLNVYSELMRYSVTSLVRLCVWQSIPNQKPTENKYETHRNGSEAC
jgi:hypothetical protein